MGEVAALHHSWEPRSKASITTLRFRQGGIGTLQLVGGQSGTSPLERLEVVGTGANVVVDNGINLTYYLPGRRGPGRRAGAAALVRGLYPTGRTVDHAGAGMIQPWGWRPAAQVVIAHGWVQPVFHRRVASSWRRRAHQWTHAHLPTSTLTGARRRHGGTIYRHRTGGAGHRIALAETGRGSLLAWPAPRPVRHTTVDGRARAAGRTPNQSSKGGGGSCQRTARRPTSPQRPRSGTVTVAFATSSGGDGRPALAFSIRDGRPKELRIPLPLPTPLQTDLPARRAHRVPDRQQ